MRKFRLVPDEGWRHIIDDFSATFGVTKHSLLESFTFSLLDDEGVPALREASQLLPEISSPIIHPKVAQVLLEQENDKIKTSLWVEGNI
ncbi:hypothetical protein P3L10_032233 [Capsicum annuum]